MIHISHVNFSYKSNEISTLKSVNLKVEKGECILVTGRSGCGKTTLTKLINGLIPHFYEGCDMAGQVWVDALNIQETPMYEIAKRVGSVFQNPKSQFFYINSNSELSFSMENSGTKYHVMLDRLHKTIETLSIEKLLNRNVFEMSGGEKQALAFASSYVSQPNVLVLDEPTANLDTGSIVKLKELLQEAKKQGKTIVITEHRLWFLKDIADRVLVMDDGNIVKEYTHDAFFGMDERERLEAGLRSASFNQIGKPSAKSKGMLTVHNMSYQLGHCCVHGLNFGADPGEVLGVYGHNGCGKTTLLYLLGGLLKMKEGSVEYESRLLKRKDLRKLTYMVMQDVNHQLFAEDVLTECMLGNNVKEDEVKRVLAHLNILHHIHMHPMALSGGQKQRLAIATAVLSDCPIILFDEPTSGLDFEHMTAYADMMNDLKKKGKIIIIVSHDDELLHYCADRILYLNGA